MSQSSPPSGALRRIFGGLGMVLGGKAGAGLISLAYLVIATRALGPHDYGVLVLIHTYITTVCGIVEFPSWQAVVRYGAEAQRADDRHRLSRLLRFGARVELLGGLAAILVAAACAPLVGPRLGWPETAIILALPYSLAVLGSVRSTPAGYLQLLNRFDLLGLHNLVAPSIRLLGAGIAALAGWGLNGFLAAWLLAALCEFATLWALGLWQARRHLGADLHRSEQGDAVTDNPGIWRFLMASNADVTLTELARMVAGGQGGPGLRRTLGRVVAIAVGTCLPVVLIVWLFADQLVGLIAGPAFAEAAGLMVVLVIARALAIAGPPCSAALTALGKPGWSMGANLAVSLLFLPALPPLLHLFGLAGAGVQAMAQSLAASLLLLVLAWRRSGMS